MADELKPYVKAGRMIRLFAWIILVAEVGIILALAIPVIAGRGQFTIKLILLILFSVGSAVFQLILGQAIKEHRQWGRTVGIIFGVLWLFGFPIGTLLGGYILWCLIKGWDEPVAEDLHATE